LQIRSPTPVDCRLVILVKLAKKASLEVPNAPVAPLVKRDQVSMARAKHVWRVNLVHPMTILLIRAHHAKVAIIKQARVKRLVCRAFLANSNQTPNKLLASIAKLVELLPMPLEKPIVPFAPKVGIKRNKA
jgi:hypothetical protein